MEAQQARCQRSEDAAEYVLGKLEGRQLEAFERHLRVCESCKSEVGLLQFAADAVPYLASTPEAEVEKPSPRRQLPSLDDAAAAAAARTAAKTAAIRRQLDAGSGPVSGKPILHAIPGGARETAPPPERRDGLPAHATVLGQDAGLRARRAHTHPVAGTARSTRRVLKTPVPKPAMVGLAGVAIVAIITLAISHQAANIRFQRVKAGWSTGGAAVRFQGTQLEILVLNMPRPKSGTGYQVWVMDKNSKKLVPSSKWLRLNKAGEAGVTIPGNYHDWSAAAVYVEPLRGRVTTKSGAVVVADLRREA